MFNFDMVIRWHIHTHTHNITVNFFPFYHFVARRKNHFYNCIGCCWKFNIFLSKSNGKKNHSDNKVKQIFTSQLRHLLAFKRTERIENDHIHCTYHAIHWIFVLRKLAFVTLARELKNITQERYHHGGTHAEYLCGSASRGHRPYEVVLGTLYLIT